MTAGPDVVVSDVAYAEGLRWHDGVLWYSDMLRDEVCTVDAAGTVTKVFDVDEPSGLGFLADGRVLVVGRGEGSLLVGERGGALTSLCALTAQGVIGVNDLVADNEGRSYVGSLGAVYQMGDEFRSWDEGAPGCLLRVDPDGTWTVAAADLACPNGMVITPDGAQLIVAETHRRRITVYDRDDAGGLHNPRRWASIGTGVPDGLALDAAGAVWVGAGAEFTRVDAAGNATQRVAFDGSRCIACALGGADRRTLYMAVAQMTMEQFLRGESRGSIYAVPVDVPGAGLP